MGKGRCRAYLTMLFAICLLFVMSFIPITFEGNPVEAKAKKADGDLLIHFIDVGQGDATFIELPNGGTLLIDAGTQDYGEKVCNYIDELGYERIDCVIATHSDSDHVGGLTAVLQSFEIKHIFRPFVIASESVPADDLSTIGLTSSQILMDNNLAYTNFINAVYKETYNGEPAKVSTLSNNSFADVFLATSEPYFMVEVMYPFAESGYDSFITPSGRTTGYKIKMPKDTNDLSAIVYIATEKNKVLLMSDVSEKIESELLNMSSSDTVLRDKLASVDVFKVAHHGSKNANSVEFLNLVAPKVSIISVGAGNDYDHPNEETIERLSDITSKVYRTDVNGTIVSTISIEGKVSIDIEKGVDKIKIIPEAIMYIFFGCLMAVIVAIVIIYNTKNNKKRKTINK